MRALWAEQRDAAILAMSAAVPRRMHELMLQDENRVAAVNAGVKLDNMAQALVAPERALRGASPGIVVIVEAA